MYIKYNNFCSQEKQNKNLKQELIEVIKKFVVLLLPSENRENQNKKKPCSHLFLPALKINENENYKIEYYSSSLYQQCRNVYCAFCQKDLNVDCSFSVTD